MNTDPLWQPFLFVGILWIVIGVYAWIFDTPKSDEEVGCVLMIALPAITLLAAFVYLFWYLHVQII